MDGGQRIVHAEVVVVVVSATARSIVRQSRCLLTFGLELVADGRQSAERERDGQVNKTVNRRDENDGEGELTQKERGGRTRKHKRDRVVVRLTDYIVVVVSYVYAHWPLETLWPGHNGGI